ncbi:MAG: 50S ribosomal protein L10 [Chloroflexi bacterium]|nr:50S ribosomal protein L10 [Chloroflexota bacterium]
MPTERKIALVAELTELIKSSEAAIATGYQGMAVEEQTALRDRLRESGATLRIVKNTLLLRAADAAGRAEFVQLADGPTALVTHPDDSVAAARAVMSWRSERPDTAFEIRNAVFSGELVNAAYVADLATVPPRDELLARIAGGLVGKITELVLLLQSAQQELVGLLDARAKQLEEADS